MSSSRSVASARARRAGGDGSSRPSQLRTQPGFSKQPPAMPTPQTTQQEEPSQKDSRLSVSDAFALVTIRLGRVEMALQKQKHEIIAQSAINAKEKEISDLKLQNEKDKREADKKIAEKKLFCECQYKICSGRPQLFCDLSSFPKSSD